MANDDGERESLRKQLSRARRGGQHRYPQGLRSAAMRYAQQRFEQGIGVREVATELGVRYQTVAWWRKRLRQTGKGFQRVQLVAEQARGATVHGPGGIRIEGLELNEVAELLRRLS